MGAEAQQHGSVGQADSDLMFILGLTKIAFKLCYDLGIPYSRNPWLSIMEWLGVTHLYGCLCEKDPQDR